MRPIVDIKRIAGRRRRRRSIGWGGVVIKGVAGRARRGSGGVACALARARARRAIAMRGLMRLVSVIEESVRRIEGFAGDGRVTR